MFTADLLMTLGEDDKVCPPQYSRELFDASPIIDKTLVALPGFRHEPLMDHWVEEMVAEVKPWLERVMI